MTRFQLHCKTWDKGCGASICARAVKRVLFRGTVPCEVLFVGEAPGESENVIGQPFVGPAGKLLDRIVSRAGLYGSTITVGFTNIVGCIPREPDSAQKATEPDDDDIKTCQPRLAELLDICKPRLVVRVGKLSDHWLDPKYKSSLKVPEGVALCSIIHPAAILRMNIAQRGLEIQRASVIVSNAVAELPART